MGTFSICGHTYDSAEQFLAGIKQHYKTLEFNLQSLTNDCDAKWDAYQKARRQQSLTQLKAVYVEALVRGLHIAWAEGASEKLGLPTDSDEELDAIKELFTHC